MLSSGTTAACSMRSFGWVPASRSADSVTTSWAAVTQCTATGSSAAWRSAIHAVSAVEVEIGVVQDALAGRQAVHALTQLAVPVGLHQLHDVADFEVGCRVGDAGDASYALSRRLTSAKPASLRCNVSDQLWSALRSRPSG